MNTFKKKALYAALTGLGVMGMVGSAQAVNLNPDGLGQALIYPYYTVRGDASGAGAFNSLISVVNSTGVGKAVKVRFLEGKASQEVLDFNLYMSPYDVWTGAIVPTADGAMLKTTDTSCTSPAIPAAGVAFRPYQYTGVNADQEDQTLNRTREGYAEIIEMADIPLLDSNGQPNATLANVTHGANGIPKNCSGIIDNGTTPGWVRTDLYSGSGSLFGSMTLINPNDAQDVAFEAVALDGFYAAPAPGYGAPPYTLWFPSGSIDPNLGHVFPKTSTVVDGLDAYITSWLANSGPDAVSAVLMNESVYNEYVLEDAVAAKTDWVITFPTKWQYYDAPNTAKVRPLKGGYNLFQRDFALGGACDDVGIFYVNREEQRTSTPGDFSPPSPSHTNALCWEANVVTFGNLAQGTNTGSIFHAQNRVTLPMAFDSGWAKFTFAATTSYHWLEGGVTQYVDLSAPSPQAVSYNTVVFSGLPMVGFAVEQFNNGEAMSADYGKIWASYAGRIAHRFSKNIDLP